MAIARQQGEIDDLRERVARLERQARDVADAAERRHGEVRDEVRRALKVQADAVHRLTARLDATAAAASARVPAELAQRLAESRAREAATRTWAVALLGAVAVLAAALISLLGH